MNILCASAQLLCCFEVAPQNFWGVNGVYPFGLPKVRQSDSKLEGFQVCYPLTSLKMVGKPTIEEQRTKQVFDKMTSVKVEELKKFGKEKKLPSPSYSAYIAAKDKGNWA